VINSAAGRSFRIDGQWYVAMGRSLFAIVDLAATTTVVTASPNPSVSGANATFTATVTDAGATGTVAFKDGQMTLGSATLSGGTATFSTSSLAFGSHTITAVYGGDPDFAPSVSAPYTHQVKTATTTLLSSSANPSTAGLSVTFTATMTPSAATGSVTFSDGATVLGTTPLSSGTATLSTSSLAPGTHSITATYSGDATRAGSTSSALSQQVESSFGAPVGLVATATTATHIVVTWAGVQGATSYEVTRSSHGGGFSVVGYPTSPAFVDDGVAPDTTYLYMVRAIAGGGSFSSFSNIDPATTVIFTDDPLTPGVSVITAAHITQIRTAVNAMRASVGLAPATFSSDSVVRAVHIQELRNALDPARAALSLPALTYTDPTLVAGSTPIRAVHMQELREGCR
jgi:hypothetical protein